jgi:hypothetical protein
MENRITTSDYQKFAIRFDDNEFPHLRFGQAFMVYFHIQLGKPNDPELFYEPKREVAGQLIFKKYIKY